MASSSVAGSAVVPRTRVIPWILLSYIVLGLISFLPRVLDLGVFITMDEVNFWLMRSNVFLRALQNGDFAATAITDHPGVTTMWLGSAGIVLRRTLLAWGLLHDQSFPTILTLFRLPVAVAHTLAILLSYAYLRRMLSATTALLAALLWATDPFIIAYSRVLHVDALSGTFGALSVLAACDYWHHGRRRRSLAISAICAALSMLSKSPGMILFPMIGVIAVDAAWREAGSPWRVVRQWRPLIGWGLMCVAAVFALWPALWISPMQAYYQIHLGVIGEGAQPHQLGNYFLGQPVMTPDWRFYAVALALRLTPWTLVGVLVLFFAWQQLRATERADLTAHLWYVVLFTLAMSLFPKKFNRYLVPAFPSLDILAAVGLMWLTSQAGVVLQRLRGGANVLSRLVPVTLQTAIVLAALLNVAYWHPYSIAAFNQALGGARTGAYAFMVGWGEGLEQVAGWLNERPDITGVLTVSTYTETLQPYMLPGAQAEVSSSKTLPDKTGYVVVYNRHAQTRELDAPFNQFWGKAPPLHVVRIHGVDYAWIYHAPPPVRQSLAADFGPAIYLRGYTPPAEIQRGQRLTWTLAWAAREKPTTDSMLFAHLIGPDGERYAQIDLPLGTTAWQPGYYPTTQVPLVVPAEAPKGTYKLVIGVYDPANGQRLTLKAPTPVDPALDGPDALVVSDIEVE